MGWQDYVALTVVFGALLYLLNLARAALFASKSHCATGCGKCPSSRTNLIDRLQRTPRAVAPVGPVLTIAPMKKRGERA